MKRILLFKYIFVFIMLGMLISCSNSSTSNTGKLSVNIVDESGVSLSVFGMNLIDVNDGWFGTPNKSFMGSSDEHITANIPNEKAIIVKFIAPGYQPKYTFLTPGFENLEFEVSLKSPIKAVNPNPVVIGSFNDFDVRSGIEMKQDDNGVWVAEIETELDTIKYVINNYALTSLPGTNGKLVINKNPNGFERNFLTEKHKDGNSVISIEFDTNKFNFEKASSLLSIGDNAPSNIEGVAKIYTRMTDEHMDQLFAAFSHRQRNEYGSYNHDFSSFLNDVEKLVDEYPSSETVLAAKMAKFRFSSALNLSAEDANGLIDSMPADSPLWMIDFSLLTTALNFTELENQIEKVSSIAKESSYKSLRGEALYNLVRYYQNQENEEKLHETFFELTSNYPDFYRIPYVYQNYAPEQPIAEGKPLPYNEFTSLEGSGTLNLYELDEPYLLLDFWATWCGPCIAAMPKLHDLHEQYDSSEFAIISISVDENPERVHSFRNEWEMPWYHAHQKQSSNVIREMGIVGVPHYILLGPDRTVLSNNQTELRSGDDFTDILDKYLNKN
ncbi:MAG: redoxin domain-containing protein [Balneolaceae bacterium]|nr:redoxin domain-containing protein [Balneolaceae bacterium]